jgi:miniconductance mechanosensitive channel
MESWLSHHPDINLDMTHMVRQLQPGPTGLPLEIYCFSARQQWLDYERVQSDIFDHLYSVMELFNLKAFQYPGNVVPEERDRA